MCLGTQRANWRTVGACIGVALLFKQWALWPALPVLFAAPRTKRALTAFYACGLPASVLVPFLLASSATWTSLTNTRASLAFGQQQLWLGLAFGQDRLGDPGMLRLAWGAASVLVALRARRRLDVDTLLAAAGTIMVLRLFFEPVVLGYYLVPATAFSVVWCARNGRPILLRVVHGMLARRVLPPSHVPATRLLRDPHLRTRVRVRSDGRDPAASIAAHAERRGASGRKNRCVSLGDVIRARCAEGGVANLPLARVARGRCSAGAAAPLVLTHGDWRVDNVRVQSGRVTAIYDWDSLSLEPEASAVATAARMFCCDWDQTSHPRFPSPAEIAAFIAEYEHACDAWFNQHERVLLAASMVASLAYGARCEHSVAVPEVADSKRAMLRALGPSLLTDGLDALRDAAA